MLSVQVKAQSKIVAFHIRRSAVRHTTFCCFGVVVSFSLGEGGERRVQSNSGKHTPELESETAISYIRQAIN